MSDRTFKCIKRYVDYPKDIPKYSCIIHVPGNSSDECKVLGEFGSKYSKIMPTKDRMNYPGTECLKQKVREQSYC